MTMNAQNYRWVAAFVVGAFLWNAIANVGNAIPPPPSDVQKTLNEIGDLELIQSLSALKLTATQIQRLNKPLKEILAGGDGQRKMDYEAVRSIAADVAKAREAALNGEPVPAEVTAKVLKTSDASSARYEAVKKSAVTTVTAAASAILTDTQKDEIVTQVTKALGRKPIPREFARKPNLAPPDQVRELALAIYAERLLIMERIPEILSKLKPAPETEKSGTNKPADAPEKATNAGMP